MKRTFGKRRTVQAMQGRDEQAAAWNTVREWTGPKAIVTPELERIAARLSK